MTMIAAKEHQKLSKLSTIPLEKRTEWLVSATDAVPFLTSNARSDYVAIYVSMPFVYIHAVLAPIDDLTPADQSDLLRSHFGVEQAWCIQRASGGSEGRRIYLEPPMASPGCNSLVDGEPLVIRRTFYGMKDHRQPVEINQKIIHALGLFFIPERNAYSKLDAEGDILDVIWVHERQGIDGAESTTAVYFESRHLSEYMAVSGQAMFRKFDFTRFPQDSFHGWGDRDFIEHRAPDLFYNGAVQAGHGSYINGGQVVRSGLTLATLIEAWATSEDPLSKEYASFKIHDWKNSAQVEVSCSPNSLSNYFTKSDKPFEISPAFFKPEVLARYKSDPDKYDLHDRSISCRNAWYLKTYDVNEFGQVHTYIGYLGGLPFSEQMHWKLYNEWPKGPISERAYQNDFLGEWSEPDALQALKQSVSDLDQQRPKWWKPRGAALAAAVLYPSTPSAKDWADEILALDQLVVEGFVSSELKKIAKRLGVEVQPDWQSLKLIEAILIGLGTGVEQAKVTVAPLGKLHHIRSKVKGHAAPDARKALERQAIADHGTYRQNFDALAVECGQALTAIMSSFALLGESGTTP